MIDKRNIKNFELIFLIAILLSIGFVSFISLNKGITVAAITGFAIGNETGETTTTTIPEETTTTTIETIETTTTTIEEMINETTTSTTTIPEETTTTSSTTTTIDETVNETISKTITLNLEYKGDSFYDVDNNGAEPITEIIDLTVKNSQFS